jgi:hypothetical protein
MLHYKKAKELLSELTQKNLDLLFLESQAKELKEHFNIKYPQPKSTPIDLGQAAQHFYDDSRAKGYKYND